MARAPSSLLKWTVLALGGLAAAAATACSSEGAAPPAGGAAAAEPPAQEDHDPPGERLAPAPYGPEVRSLRLTRSIVVRLGPSSSSKNLGTVARDIRVTWRGAAPSTEADCELWIAIEPRGFVCSKYLEPSTRAPWGVELPKLAEGEIVPGVYGKVGPEGARAYKSIEDVRAGKAARLLEDAFTVRRVGEVAVDGTPYWKTADGELVRGDRLRLHEPSTFEGLWLDDDDAPGMPFGWIVVERRPRASAPVHSAPDEGAPMVRTLPQRTLVPVRAESDDGRWIRIDDDGWVPARYVKVARVSAPPPTTLVTERWIDVDLDEQVLVAYEGPRPVFATLVSTGSRKWPTPTTMRRIWIKFAETDMNGQMADGDRYSVATVPWTMFYGKDFALHTAYWHDRFGEPRSHGCVNLAPKDARRLYFWTDPGVPLGWSMANGVMEHPGTLIRIRSREVPEPDFEGYAQRVHEVRARRLPGPSQADLAGDLILSSQ